MLNFKRRVFFILAVFILLLSTTVVAFGEETERFDVNIQVLEDNTFLVKEEISMNFAEPGHGIFRYIPYVGYVTQKVDGKNVDVRQKIDISDMKVEGHPFEVSKEKGNVVVRIGDEDDYLTGEQLFEISYKVTAFVDPITNLDYFYYNVLGTGWEEAIQSSTITIEMPKAFDEKNLTFSGGAYGKGDQTLFTYQIDESGRVITAQNTRIIQAYEGVAANLILPQGYFTGVKSPSGKMPFFAVIAILSALITAWLWFLFGRDRKVVQTVEFYPPKGVNSSEIGYIIDGSVEDRDLISLIIFWANQGNLKIIEKKNKKGKADGFLLEKQKNLEAKAETYEKTMFNSLFKEGATVDIAAVHEEFADAFETAKELLAEKYTESKACKIFTGKSGISRVVGALLVLVPVVCLGIFGFMESIENPMTLVIIAPAVLLIVVGAIILTMGYDYKNSSSALKTKVCFIIGGLLIATGLFLEMFFSVTLLGTMVWGVIAVMTTFANVGFTMFMRQRTKYGTDLLGKVLGFKEFIRTAELDRLNRLVEEDALYFYHIIPYAYVFGLSDKWAKKFETIATVEPDWYAGGQGGAGFNTYLFMNSFNHCTSELQSNLATPPAVTSSAQGGGSNFPSGGGFSGGGMGGGGGGRW